MILLNTHRQFYFNFVLFIILLLNNLFYLLYDFIKYFILFTVWFY